MIYIAAVVFPLLSIVCGVATLIALVRYVIDIRSDIKSKRT
jgi:hypothetical protein